jgi:hypothetical protein
MLNLGNTLGSSGTSLSLDTRVAVGAGVFVVSPAESSEPAVEARVTTTPEPKVVPIHNAFEFKYRSDIGKIILLQQNVETGQEVTQVPNEYHLRQYAANQREQRLQSQQKLYKGSVVTSSAESGPRSIVAAKTSAAPSGPSAPAASQPAAPTVALSAGTAAAASHVDIKA